MNKKSRKETLIVWGTAVSLVVVFLAAPFFYHNVGSFVEYLLEHKEFFTNPIVLASMFVVVFTTIVFSLAPGSNSANKNLQ